MRRALLALGFQKQQIGAPIQRHLEGTQMPRRFEVWGGGPARTVTVAFGFRPLYRLIAPYSVVLVPRSDFIDSWQIGGLERGGPGVSRREVTQRFGGELVSWASERAYAQIPHNAGELMAALRRIPSGWKGEYANIASLVGGHGWISIHRDLQTNPKSGIRQMITLMEHQSTSGAPLL